MTLSNLIFSELPLVIFTVMAQMSVGFSLIYVLTMTKHSANDHQHFGKIFLVCMSVSVIASLFHLGDPFHAPYMLFRLFDTQNIAWLPLEILGVGITMSLALLLVIKKINVLIYMLPIAGFLTLFAMSGIYGSMANTIPTWSFSLTFFLFCSTSMLLGGFCYRFFFVNNTKEAAIALLFSSIGLTLFSITLVAYTQHIGEVRIDSIANAFDLMHGYYGYFVGGGLLLIGIGFSLLIYNDTIKICFTCKDIIVLAFALCFIGVFLTRMAFYGLITSHIFLG